MAILPALQLAVKLDMALVPYGADAANAITANVFPAVMALMISVASGLVAVTLVTAVVPVVVPIVVVVPVVVTVLPPSQGARATHNNGEASGIVV